MRTISYKLDDLKKIVIPIGFEGENDHTRVIIDAGEVFAQYPSAAASLRVKPPQGNIYPVVVSRDGDRVIWNVKDTDCASDGNGEAQFTFTENNVIVKSVVTKIKINRSLKATGPAPDPIEDWLDTAEDVLEEVQAAEVNQPTIGEDGYWYTWDQETGEYEKTNTKAQGADGHSPVLTSSKDGKTTTLYADGEQIAQIQDGEDGQGADVIDDTSGEGDTDKTWSADKLTDEFGDVLTAIQGITPDAQQSDIGKALILKTIDQTGKPTAFEYGEAGGGSVDPSVVEQKVDEWLTENISNPDSPPLDRSLSSNVSAAPADLVGNILNSVHHYTFESGTFNSTTGATTTNNGRARTTGFVSDIVDIVDASLIADGALVYAWDSTDTYVGFWGGSGWVTSGSKYLSKIDFTQLRKNYPGYKYKLVVQSNNSSTAQQSVIDDIISKMIFIDTDSLAHRVDELEKNALQINPLNQNIGVEYASGGYSLSYDGTITVTESNARLHTVENIPSDVKSITCLSGFVFLLYAMNSNGKSAGSYKEDGSFSNGGTSALLTHIDLTKYNYYGFRIVLRSDNGTDAVTIKDAQENLIFTPFATPDSDVTSEDEPDIYVDRDNNLCLCAIKTDILDNKIPYHRGFLFHSFASGTGNKMYYGNSFDKVKEIGTFPIDPRDWRFAISPKDGTIIAAKREQRNWLYVFNEDVIRTLSFSTNAMAWLYNSGVEFIKDENDNEYCIFAEYDGNAPYDEFNVWRGTYPYTSNSDWSVVKTMTPQEIGHFHMVKRDPWSNVLYLTSGDDSAQCFWWYSTDFGETWTLLTSGTASGWEDHICRTINFIFTEDAVYWATDKGTNHCLNKATRDINGIIDPSTRVKLCDLPSGQATNSLCYVESPKGLFMYERIDIGYTTQYGDPVSFKFYDLTDNTLKDLMDIPMAEESWGGCRGKCYINYTNSVQPLPAMGFSTDTPCIFNIVADDLDKIGTIVFDPASKRFYTVNKE